MQHFDALDIALMRTLAFLLLVCVLVMVAERYWRVSKRNRRRIRIHRAPDSAVVVPNWRRPFVTKWTASVGRGVVEKLRGARGI